MLTQGPRSVQFASGGPTWFDFVIVAEGRGGWAVSTAEACRPYAVRRGLAASTWRLDPAGRPVGRDTTELSVQVRETHCTKRGGDSRRRLQRPDVRARRDAVEVTFFITRRPDDNARCLIVTKVPYRLQLPEPLGDRRLLDGSRYPPLDPTAARR